MDAGATRSGSASTKAGSFWTVLTDPEGNEFCVLRGPDDDWSRRRSDAA